MTVPDPAGLGAAPDGKSSVLAKVCAELDRAHLDGARGVLRSEYPFVPQAKVARRYTERESLRVFYRDGFIDRYAGVRLVNPGVLRALSAILPEDFPAHPNWQMSQTHFAFWELFPSIDHILAVSRGGADDSSNWVCTSMLRNSAKAHWTLHELGWELFAAGDHRDWDGLSRWLLDYVPAHPELRANAYVARWWRATLDVRREFVGAN